MTNHDLNYQIHLERRYKRLRTRNPVCIGCPETDPFCLELHHIAGRKYGDELAIVCRNCHRKLTLQQQFHVPPSQPEPSGDHSSIAHFILGLCDLLAMAIERLRQFAAELLRGPEHGEAA